MSTKFLIWIGILIFSTIGSWLGEVIGHGWLSLWSLVLGTVGTIFGIWIGYKIGKDYF